MATGPLPPRVSVVTIEAQRFARAAGVSPEVAHAARLVAETLLADLAAAVMNGDDQPAPALDGGAVAVSATAVPAGA